MSTAHWRLLPLLVCLATAALAPSAHAELTTVWSYAGEAENPAAVQLSVHSVKEISTDQPVAFVCEVFSKRRFRQAELVFEVESENGELVSAGTLTVDLGAGANACEFQWDAAAVAPGRYMARVIARYAPGAQPAVYTWPMLRVAASDLDNRLERAVDRLEQMREVAPAEGIAYAGLRMNLADRAIEHAREAQASDDWATLTDYVAYLEWSQQRLFDDLLLSDAKDATASQAASNDSTYRFGFNVTYSAPEALQAIAALGLNYAVAPISPSDTLAGPGKTKLYADVYEPFFEAAQEHGVDLSMRLAVGDTGAWPHEVWPEINERGTDDMSSPPLWELFQWHAGSVLPYLDSKPNVLSIELLNTPRFHFDSETVRQSFVDHVASVYPARYALNRAWHAQLRSFDEIGIWGDYRGYYDDITLAVGAEEVRYQERRAYQFDWQRFHTQLGNQRLDQVRAFTASRSAKHQYVTLPDSAFAPSESRSGLDRLHVANTFGASGVNITGRLSDPVFAMEFPQPVAACALARSMAPGNPLFVSAMRLDFAEERSNAKVYGFLSTLLWECTLAGVSATALAVDTPILDNPHAVEALAVTAQDINRLAPIVRAIQNDLPPIAVLFSTSSRIYDDGIPHLQSSLYAFEGCSFGGYGARFITEEQMANGALADVKVLVVPQTPALSDAAFDALEAYMEAGGTIARAGSPIPYNENGDARSGVLPTTGKSVLVRGMNLPTEYLHAIDAAIVHGALPTVARPVNLHGYPLEGVTTRYIEVNGQAYLYGVNLRKTPVICHLTGSAQSGQELIGGSEIAFPFHMEPLKPILVKLRRPAAQVHLAGVE